MSEDNFIEDDSIGDDSRRALDEFESSAKSDIGVWKDTDGTSGEIRREIVDNIVKQQPPEAFVKRHPFGKFDYIPIAIIEPLAQMLDPLTETEILREGQVVNAFYCVVRLKFNGRTYDGIGAAEFQTSKGAAPTDFTKLNTGAVQMAVPKARSEAVKNAFAQVGDLFGRGLRRPHAIDMDTMESSHMAKSVRAREAKLKKLNERVSNENS